MKINKKRNGTVNPKTGKTYSVDFKKRTVQYYLLGMYNAEQIWKKFQINSTLLEKWRKWYYKYGLRRTKGRIVSHNNVIVLSL